MTHDRRQLHQRGQRRQGLQRSQRLQRQALPCLSACLLLVCVSGSAAGQDRVRARDLGVPFRGEPGPNNAITDVAGVAVGQVTLIEGDGALAVGEGPVRTGVTAIVPRAESAEPVFAGWYTLNGNGEMTGTTWVEESGFLEGPVMITNTHSVGVVRDAVIDWQVRQGHGKQPWALPVVAETYDGFLNDINGFHVKPEHAFAALRAATSGPVQEGAVGGGTGMICHSFKCGIGTASRRVEIGGKAYMLGALVQANYGGRPDLMIAGAPVGREITDLRPQRGSTSAANDAAGGSASAASHAAGGSASADAGLPTNGRLGSIIVVVATDVPLLPHQLKRIARRVPLGIARMGGMGGNSSGDIFIAFSTANASAASGADLVEITSLSNEWITPLFQATAYAVEEAITNALVAGRTMVGRDGNTVYGIPHDRLRAVLQKYGRLEH